ncbi:MAG: glycosyltransferase, partial [Actinomycetota bacterium]|nr:glycosyltransferase [Actinomycetota bacterium]
MPHATWTGAVTVVMITRNRRADIVRSLGALDALPEQPEVIVVDNASTDGTAALLKRSFPQIRVIEAPHNLGAAARNVGVEFTRAPYVAFSDDDSWWAPGSLARAVEIFDAHPHVGLIAAKILVGMDGTVDPTSHLMERSPLQTTALPGPSVVGFLACGSLVRRDAFVGAGGFWPRLGIGAEEELLALQLREAGWDLAYVAEIVAHHHPS